REILGANKAEKIDESSFAHFNRAQPVHCIHPCRAYGYGHIRTEEPAHRVAEHIYGRSDRIAQGCWTQIGSHHVRALSDAPNKQRLAEIAALLRQSLAIRNIEEPAHTKNRIHDE